jgi:microcystin degradation protein MlrC
MGSVIGGAAKMTNKPTILVGQIWHEGHSFNPVITRREDFLISRGHAVLDEARTSSTALSGIVKVADRLDYPCIPVIAARARPGGLVEQVVFEELADEFVRAASRGGFGAICLELHGATAAEQTFDTEGDLLERLRAVVGPDIPVIVAADLHGYITPKMVDNATIITGYRTTPHSDIVETGERAMALLDGVLTTGLRPYAVRTLIPFLTRGNDETSSVPMVAIGAAADKWRASPGIVDVSIFNVHPFLDVPGLGQVVLAYDDGAGAAVEASRELATMLWAARDEFVEQLISVEDALTLAAESDQPLALGDQGDRVVGAGPGDSAEIARVAAERFPGLAVAVPIFDPAAVAAATAAGEGAEITLAVGGSVTPQLKPLSRAWRVRRLARARFVNKGPYMAGVEADFGDAAVLTSDALTVIVTARAPNVHDPAFYEAMGVPITSQKALVARAANHYKLSFAGLARTMTVDTPGLTAFRPHEFPFKRARPFHPLDAVEWSFGSIQATARRGRLDKEEPQTRASNDLSASSDR